MKPSRRQAETKVLRIRQAMVIGPTPPGTGVIAPATSLADSKSTSPTSALLGAVDADVDHRRAGLQPLARDHLGPADRGDDDIGAADDVGQVAGAAMRDRYRAAFRSSSSAIGLPTMLERPITTASLPDEVAELGLEQLEAAQRRAGNEAVKPDREPAGVDRVEAVDVLVGGDPGNDLALVDLRRERELDEDAVDRRDRR